MINESNLESTFIRFLTEDKGYPSAYLRSQLAFVDKDGSRRLRPDLVVIDPGTNKVVAIIEFKGLHTPPDQQSVRQQVLAYRRASGNDLASAYVVYPYSEQEPNAEFGIYEVEDVETWVPVKPHDFPDYETLILGERAKSRTTIVDARDTAVDTFKYVCFGLSLLVTILFLLDLLAVVSMTAQQLSLLGIAIALVLIPYAARLRFLGVEFERLQEASERKSM